MFTGLGAATSITEANTLAALYSSSTTDLEGVMLTYSCIILLYTSGISL